jgi:hypothetical protein
VTEGFRGAGAGEIEVFPLVLVVRDFPARPSSLPEIREFVRRRLTHTPFSDEDIRTLGERVSDVLLDVAGPKAMIQVSLRILPDHAEVDVLPSNLVEGVLSVSAIAAPGPAEGGPVVTAQGDTARPSDGAPSPDQFSGTSFADWLAGALRRDGVTMETAARQLGVSTKTVSRWVGGTTEPRLRDLSRIREIFGELPFP